MIEAYDSDSGHTMTIIVRISQNLSDNHPINDMTCWTHKQEYRQTIWNERLRYLMNHWIPEGGSSVQRLSQKKLAELLNEKYNHGIKGSHFDQKTISRWLNLGKKGTTFPSYEHMLMVADFFGVQLAYMTGDIDGYSHDEQSISEYLGIETETVRVLHEEIGNKPFAAKYFKDELAALNKFMGNSRFTNQLPEALSKYLQACSPEPKTDIPNTAINRWMNSKAAIEYAQAGVWSAMSAILEHLATQHPWEDYLDERGRNNKKAQEEQNMREINCAEEHSTDYKP